MFVHICSAGSITELLIAAPEGWPSGLRHNWRRPLPRPIMLPDVPLKLSTLADVRALVHKRLPVRHRSKQTWQRVAPSSILGSLSAQLPEGGDAYDFVGDYLP
jgi:hypothetical protein